VCSDDLDVKNACGASKVVQGWKEPPRDSFTAMLFILSSLTTKIPSSSEKQSVSHEQCLSHCHNQHGGNEVSLLLTVVLQSKTADHTRVGQIKHTHDIKYIA
jgi:hypothetical protein